jgi:hypothetical protein
VNQGQGGYKRFRCLTPNPVAFRTTDALSERFKEVIKFSGTEYMCSFLEVQFL